MAERDELGFMKIRRYVIDAIAANGMRPTAFPSTHKLAKLFKVSQPTALRAIRDLIAEGYLAAQPRGGTISRPSPLLKGDEFKIFGCCCSDGKQVFSNYYFSRLRAAVSLELTKRDHRCHVQELHVETPSSLRSVVGDARLSGLMLLAIEPALGKYALELKREGLPVVSFTRLFEGLSSVYDPLDDVFRDILFRLFKEGRSKILIVSWHNEQFSAMIRKGVEAARKEANAWKRTVVILDGTQEENEKRLKELLSFGVEYDGAIFYSFQRELYETLAGNPDASRKCCFVCDESALPASFGFTGYVLNYRLEAAAKALVDDLLLQESGSSLPPVAEKIGYWFELFKDGRPCQ